MDGAVPLSEEGPVASGPAAGPATEPIPSQESAGADTAGAFNAGGASTSEVPALVDEFQPPTPTGGSDLPTDASSGAQAPEEQAPEATQAPEEQAPEATQAPEEQAPEEQAPEEQAAHGPEATQPEPERWCLVVVAGVSMDLPSAYPQVVLRESVTPYREIRIPMGLAEGTAIAHAWRRVDTPRPITHDAVTQVLKLHNVIIEAVRITGRRGQIFFAHMETSGPRGRHVVDCRPSDAIALALRQLLPTPILVVEEVLSGQEFGG